MSIVHLDFELAGVLDLRDTGAYEWMSHADTVPIFLGYAIDDDPPDIIYLPNTTPGAAIAPLMREINAGAEIHAWNANFERIAWNQKMVPAGFPYLPVERFHCTMAAAANAGLPLDLDGAATAVGSPIGKDKAGTALMKRMVRPRNFNPDGSPRWWHVEDAQKRSDLALYCMRDVNAEREVFRRVPRMKKREREIWLLDQRMNDRGLPVDHDLLAALGDVTLQEMLRFNDAIRDITGGVVTSMTQHAKLLYWLKAEGYSEENLRKDTLKEYSTTVAGLDSGVSFAGAEALVLRAEAAKTSTAKLKSIANYSQRDSRARGLVQYGGAVRTLRWAGRGPQIQNFPRPIVRNVDHAIDEILQGADADSLRHIFGRPLDVVSSCLRGVFKALPGYKFVVCDFHAIEAVVIAWLADFDELLEVFRRGEDVYIHTANSIGSDNRTLGKVLRLACGFGMGGVKFQDTAKGYDLTLSEVEATRAVQAFRTANAPLVSLWRSYERAAKNVIMSPGTEITVNGKVKFRMADPRKRMAGALVVEKPSGSHLVYRNARVRYNRIVFDGVHQITRQWGEQDTYGGKLAENLTQSVARDLLADAMLAFEVDYPGALLTTVHDEIVAMVPEAFDAALSSLKTLMSYPPAWAAGMPLSAAGYTADRYSKA